MKTILKNWVSINLIGIMLIGLNACAKDQVTPELELNASVLEVAYDGTSLVSEAGLKSVLSPAPALGENELQILLHMKEEEKLARDVYTFLSQKWGVPIFSRISGAETTHMNAVIFLLQNYGSEYTQTGEAGIFTNTEFQELYKSLTERGTASFKEALLVGALIEDMDIKDLSESIDKVTDENIILVFENLMKGSRNHLRAFNRQLVALGVTYTPEYISQEDFDLIVSSPHETGRKYQRIQGNGRQYRNGW